ncbi:MAG: hypothetical protein A2921_04370 [Candidatus Magasanikbacteria bacterium RIFCSPLOWO2_01_FULL_43_20b]|uniref:Uncharacterized protein n=1 Tax=Candidatus Magasanikbacteria bacterium RIFCSPLOWO2_12_FULL_43_12 TaxID=1798692 RepID=A0A1F6MRP7_9BACT|nr:MAG: hypothetical protein A3C74_02785 [Candidatus Magasanikbacteria bacterium RIFCSPHIGHO2_02_FULL_44_13]OGH73305.1 MAG: hypothetical protein A2921_04370 [Candidatus Magasanikbacteria bacterium RIFCSPLOWO2_01_FULL_43_20b]OGH74312.1 MAG: hypothetical protein A3G00_02560 [Candidatus Magasanikbacteria bacterium RIFCSPLOWO2_12_FULL_43_12]
MRNKSKFLVVCHDTGGAEIISAFVKLRKKKNDCICFISGPAVKIFRRKKIKISIIRPVINIERVLKKYQQMRLTVLTEVGWSTDLGIKTILAAKKKSIKTAAYLDHWVNYKERFGFPRSDWVNNLPDEIWVGDKAAYLLAKRTFPCKVVIRYIPNQYFREIEAEYDKSVKIKPALNLLIVSEPLGEAINSYGQKLPILFNEFKWLEIILSNLARSNFKDKVILRLHPSEAMDKYDSILAKYVDKIRLEKSRNSSIMKDLIRVDTVIGATSMALVVAAICQKKVFSLILDKFLLFFVPKHPHICKLRAERDLLDKLKFVGKHPGA